MELMLSAFLGHEGARHNWLYLKMEQYMSEEHDKAASFSREMVRILNYGALNLAIGIGYETGVFEAMADLDQPETCGRIASVAGVSERYLYEWLGVMVCGEVVEACRVEGEPERFFLPKEHVSFLCQRGGENNLGVYTQEIPLLTQCAREGVLAGMRTGEGLPYAAYPKFYSFMEQLANAKHRNVLVEDFLPSVMDGEIVRRLRKGIEVCDVGCAEGIAMELMARAFPASSFTGVDISEQSIENARQRVRSKGLQNIRFEVHDAAGPDGEVGRFDYVTAFDAIHDQTRPLEALRNIHSMLKPSGVFSMIDIAASSTITGNTGHPMGAFLYTVSLMHCMPVGMYDGGAGLGMMWGREKAVSLCREAGFNNVSIHEIPRDGFNDHYLCLK